jgi:hypothetical protein
VIEFLAGPFLEFSFMRRALVGCFALSLSAPPIGVFLTLRRMSLMSDAMSHAILPGVAVGFLVSGLWLPAMTLGGLAAGLAVALLSGLVARFTAVKEDASFAAFYLVSLSLGVVLVSAKGSNVDLMHILFGTVLALDDTALVLIGAVAAATLLWLAAAYRPLVIECVDPLFLRLSGRASADHSPVVPGDRGAQPRGRVPGARDPARGRHHAPAGCYRALLGNHLIRPPAGRGRRRAPVQLCGPAPVLPCRVALRPGHRGHGRRALLRVGSLRAKRWRSVAHCEEPTRAGVG